MNLPIKTGVLQHQKSWHSNGQLEEDINCDENGEIDGEVIVYDENGNVKEKKNYVHGVQEGQQMTVDGGYTETYTMKNNIKTSDYCRRYSNGNIAAKGTFNDRENPIGVWFYGDKNGDTTSIINHLDNNGDYEITTYNNGKPWRYAEYADGVQNGKFIEYSKQPPYRILAESNYKNDEEDGDRKVYDNNGALQEVATYEDGNRVMDKYYKDGKLFRMQKLTDDGYLMDVPLPADTTEQKTAVKTVAPKPATRKSAPQKPAPPKLKQDASGIIDVQ